MADSTKKENKPSFFEGVVAEWNKITWPAKEQLTKQSIAVVVTTIILGIVITVLDFGLQYGVSLLSK
ncbi:MAG: preprotein translocase subunit SecE [Lachnospiraceae bacterium]|nr:preprotein translocase subunit SecE [Candidatus Colinaster scatohippi]